MSDVIREPTSEPFLRGIDHRTDTTLSRVKSPRLSEQIKQCLAKSAFSKLDFLPQSDLDDLLNETNIRRELRKSGCGKDPELITFIQNHAKKTFAILAYRGLVKYATGLNIYKFTDDYLPIEEKSAQVTSLSGFLKDEGALDWFLTWRLENVKSSSPIYEDSDTSSDEDFAESDTIDWANIGVFRDTQWIFLAKVFKKGLIFQTVYDKCPLPIIEYEKGVASGGYSALHKGRIHPAHQVGLITVGLYPDSQMKLTLLG